MNAAFIPVRGGSKSIALKNIKYIAGKPLVYWSIKAACGCSHIDKVYVATDSEEIRRTVQWIQANEKDMFFKVVIIGRSKESASDTASTESAMIEFAEEYCEFDNIVLIQATSPMIKSEDLDRGFASYEIPNTDGVLSVVRQKRFVWSQDSKNLVKPVNYDIFNRPRRQEFDGYLVENGAFYITSRERLLATGNRLSGNIRAVEMSENTYFEIDEPNDWIIIEQMMEANGFIERKEKNITPIKMFLTDCDGCLTDGGMYYSEFGDELKKFNTKDGMAFQILRNKGIITGIITSENVDLNNRRAKKLKVDVLEMGCTDKLERIKALCNKYAIDIVNVCYVGDDINDIEAVEAVGFGCSVNNGDKRVKNVAKYISKADGGNGAIREIVDYILSLNKE